MTGNYFACFGSCFQEKSLTISGYVENHDYDRGALPGKAVYMLQPIFPRFGSNGVVDVKSEYFEKLLEKAVEQEYEIGIVTEGGHALPCDVIEFIEGKLNGGPVE